MAGNFVLMVGLVIIFYNVSMNIGPLAELPQSDSFSKTLMCICLTLFALEGIGFVLPLEGETYWFITSGYPTRNFTTLKVIG